MFKIIIIAAGDNYTYDFVANTWEDAMHILRREDERAIKVGINIVAVVNRIGAAI